MQRTQKPFRLDYIEKIRTPRGWCRLRPLAYVCCGVSGKVDRVDLVSGEKTGEMDCGKGFDPCFMAVDACRQQAYLCATQAKAVMSLSLVCCQPTGPVSVGGHPVGAALSPCGRYLYIALEDKALLSVLDTRTLQSLGGILLLAPSERIVVTADGRMAVLTLPTQNQTALVDLCSGELAVILATGRHPGPLAMADERATACVLGRDSHTLTTVLTESMEIGGELTFEQRPSDLTLLPGGRRCLVSLGQGGRIVEADLITGQVDGGLPVGGQPGALACGSLCTLAAVCDEQKAELLILDTEAMTLRGTVAVSPCPVGVALVE